MLSCHVNRLFTPPLHPLIKGNLTYCRRYCNLQKSAQSLYKMNDILCLWKKKLYRGFSSNISDSNLMFIVGSKRCNIIFFKS